MLFTVLVILVIIAPIATFIFNVDEGGIWAAFLSVIALVVAGVVSLFIFLGVVSVGDGPRLRDSVTNKHTLQAIDTGSGVEGQFFLGGGTVDGERVINYIYTARDADGQTYSKVDQQDASDSRIYEDLNEDDTPFVETRTTQYLNRWIAPHWLGGLPKDSVNEFHVPKGSVLENYQISNR